MILSSLCPGSFTSWSAPVSEGRTSLASCFLSRFPQTPAQGNAGLAGRHTRPRPYGAFTVWPWGPTSVLSFLLTRQTQHHMFTRSCAIPGDAQQRCPSRLLSQSTGDLLGDGTSCLQCAGTRDDALGSFLSLQGAAVGTGVEGVEGLGNHTGLPSSLRSAPDYL